MKKLFILLASFGLLSGCASIPFDIDSEGGTILEANKRVFFSTAKAHKDNNKGKIRICAEPSPDVSVQIALALQAKSSSFTYTTTLEKLTERSRSVQLLRDWMYRMCEAWVNHAVGADTYYGTIAAYPNTMIATHAIDAIATKGATATLTTKQVEAIQEITEKYFISNEAQVLLKTLQSVNDEIKLLDKNKDNKNKENKIKKTNFKKMIEQKLINIYEILNSKKT